LALKKAIIKKEQKNTFYNEDFKCEILLRLNNLEGKKQELNELYLILTIYSEDRQTAFL